MPSRLSVDIVARAREHRLAFLYVAVSALLALTYYLPGPAVVRELGYDGTGLLAALAIIAGIHRHHPEHPAPWRLVAAGIAMFAAGDVAWSVLELGGEIPYPSIADIAYLLGYPALTLAFLRMIVVRVGDGDRSGLLDAAIMATAVSLLGFVRLLRPVLDASGDPLSLAISVAYPLGDLVIIGVAIGLVATPGVRGASFALLVGAILAQFAGDVVYAIQLADETFVDGSLLDLTWMASYTMAGLAALVPSMRHVATPNPVAIAWLSRTRLAFMTIAMLTGPALVLVHAEPDVPLLVAGSAFLSMMVVARLAVIVRALARDNAARRSLEDELSYRASHDPLTGLSNRRAFLERLDLAVAQPGHEPLTVLFLDLDDFKSINDTLGHATGDALLVAVARRIRGHLRHGDVAARMGGDEFGILLRADESLAARVGQRILDGFREPISVGGRNVAARGSIGVTQARPGVLVSDLLADADVAMYEAKAMGKNQVCAFAPEMRVDVAERMELEADLRAAIAGDKLALQYQPIVNLETGVAVGVEALVRWTHPTRGVLAPSMFIPFAEATGQGRSLGMWVLERACSQLAEWRRTLDPDLVLAVNLAPRQLAGTDLVSVVWGAAERAHVPMNALIVDVTEGALLLDAPEVAANLAALRALGARVAIDDFGTGYSSLGYLGRLPVDILKIDRAFVQTIELEEERSLVGIVVGLGQALGLETIAEGIEREEQLEAVRRLGCRLGQGYHLGAPAAPAGFEARYAPAPSQDVAASPADAAAQPAGTPREPASLLPGLPFATGA